MIAVLLEEGPPGPPAWVVDLPVVGPQIAEQWLELERLGAAWTSELQPYLEAGRDWLLSIGVRLGEAILQVSLSVLAAFFFFRDGAEGARRLSVAVERLAGHRAQQLLAVAGGTVRSVIYGVIGTALAQAALQAFGLWLAGVPAPFFLGFLTFFLGFVPLGPPLVWLPAAMWLLYNGAVGAGIFLAIWGFLVVSGADNILRPYLISRGSSLPLLLVFLGVVGGVLALGVALIIQRLLVTMDFLAAHALIFALAAGLMVVSSLCFVAAGEPPVPRLASSAPESFGIFLQDGAAVFRADRRFRLFLFTQWLGGATLMALPFYVVAANRLGLGTPDVAVLLGAQTVGSLASNAPWGWIGDRFGKLRLLESVGLLRLLPPLGMLLMLIDGGLAEDGRLLAFAVLFVSIGALINGMTISYLGFLMETSPDDRRPAYSAYFNALASPAALLPLVGATVARLISLEAVFTLAMVAAVIQLGLLRKLRMTSET